MLAILAVGTASPALARKEAKKTDPIAVIKARIAQLRVDPQDRKCLGADAVTCLASLSLGVPPTAELGGFFELPAPAGRDIYGRTVSATMSFLIKFNATNRDFTDDDDVSAQIDLSDGEHVGTIHFSLNQSPLFAQTESDWDATRVFELATAVLGPACVGTDRIAFYRRYDAIQRQGSTDYVDRGRSAFHYSLLAGNMKICGVTMSVQSSSQYSRSLGYGSSLRFTL
ncbi:MAG TPA: hypothetical protein VN137_13075 [Sphingomonas sp.]|nr:hypothetical protein [Sphingomonas sp.]